MALQLRYLQTLARDRDREQLDDHLPGADRPPAAVPRRRHGRDARRRRHVRLRRPRLRAAAGADRAGAGGERDARGCSCSSPSADALAHARVARAAELLRAGDLLVLNDTRVVPARLRGRRPSGGRLELLLLASRRGDGAWEALVRGSAAGRASACTLPDGARASGRARWATGRWRLRLDVEPAPCSTWLERVGEVPLPPYIRAPGRADRRPIASATRPSSRACPARSPRRPRGCTSRRRCSPRCDARASRASTAHAARRPGHVPAGARRRPRTHRDGAGALRAARGDRRRASRATRAGGRARRRGRHDHGARARVGGAPAGALRAGAGEAGALHPPGPRVPGGRRAAHELPPAALDAARAGRRVRRPGRAFARLRRGGARRATASTATATRC